MKFKNPWHYLTWRPPVLSGEHEMALARKIRREGMFPMISMFWGLVTTDERGFTWGCARILFAQNYTGFICAIGLYTETPSLLVAGTLWLVSLLLGTARYVGWLFWLLKRWPPMASS